MALNWVVALTLLSCCLVFQFMEAKGALWVRFYVVLAAMALLFFLLMVRIWRCPDCRKSILKPVPTKDNC